MTTAGERYPSYGPVGICFYLMRWVYLVLAVLGAVLPYSQFVPFLAEHGLDLSLFFEQLFANRISAFFGLDVIVSALAVLVFIAASRATLGGGRAVACGVATLGIGPSCGLPLLLFFLASSDGRVEVPSEKGVK